MISRRKLLIGGGLLGGLGLYSYQRGLRYPRLSWEHAPLANSTKIPNGNVFFKDAIATSENTFRAIAPEPKLSISTATGQLEFTISNIASNAIMHIEGQVPALINEQTEGLNRVVEIQINGDTEFSIHWKLNVEDGFDFAVMGDTGGGSELDWTLKRAHQLGAQFLLHLGDFNYSEGEYQAAIDAFNTSPIPSYISIGNHDFHHNGLIYQRFLNELGPMNHAFELTGTRFINLDTAADFFPAHSGLRGKLINTLHQQAPYQGEQVFFSHRPLKDPRPHDDHEVGGINEIEWLTKSIKALGGKNYLHGHVHHSAEIDFNGMHHLSIGEGLGHEDLVLQKKVAQILMARVEPNQALAHRWVDLNMPWELHQSPTHAIKLKRDGRQKQLDWYRQLLR
jgi:hypothetical protein